MLFPEADTLHDRFRIGLAQRHPFGRAIVTGQPSCTETGICAIAIKLQKTDTGKIVRGFRDDIFNRPDGVDADAIENLYRITRSLK